MLASQNLSRNLRTLRIYEYIVRILSRINILWEQMADWSESFSSWHKTLFHHDHLWVPSWRTDCWKDFRLYHREQKWNFKDLSAEASGAIFMWKMKCFVAIHLQLVGSEKKAKNYRPSCHNRQQLTNKNVFDKPKSNIESKYVIQFLFPSNLIHFCTSSNIHLTDDARF